MLYLETIFSSCHGNAKSNKTYSILFFCGSEMEMYSLSKGLKVCRQDLVNKPKKEKQDQYSPTQTKNASSVVFITIAILRSFH